MNCNKSHISCNSISRRPNKIANMNHNQTKSHACLSFLSLSLSVVWRYSHMLLVLFVCTCIAIGNCIIVVNKSQRGIEETFTVQDTLPRIKYIFDPFRESQPRDRLTLPSPQWHRATLRKRGSGWHITMPRSSSMDANIPSILPPISCMDF